VKAGWEVKPLGEVCEIRGGGTPSKQKKEFWGGEVPWVSPKDMKFRTIVDSIDKTTDEAVANSAAKHIPKGAVLIVVRSGILSRTIPVAIAGRDLTVNQDLKALLPSEQLDSQYLTFFLEARERLLLDKVTRGATVHKIDTPVIKGLELPIPPLDEQKRIVAVLDAAFEGLTRAKENAEANLQNARELFEATLDKCLVQDAREWPEYELSSLGKLTTGGTPKSGDSGQYGDALPFIKPGHFQTDGSLDYHDVGLSRAGADSARVIPENSAVMVCIGATIGKSGHSDRPIATNQQINALTPNEKLHNYFAYLHFITPTFQKQVIANSGQATLPIINKTKWGKLKIRVPSNLDEQQNIVDRMKEVRVQVDLAVNDYRTKLTDIADLRQSLLQKAFAGELT